MAKHALLSASGAHRWLECTPSALLELQFPQSTSEYAAEGTAAHELCELTARYWLGEVSEMDFENRRDELAKGPYYNAEMQECANDYRMNIISNTARTHAELMAGTYKSRGFYEFDIYDRGKWRHIRSVHITERAVQRNLCDQVITKVFQPAFIYDNAASIKGKGIDFAMDRLNCHLQRHFRKYGLKGGILVFDFKDYFGSAQHWTVQNELARRVHDPETRKLANDFLENFGSVGYGLGSQISQNAALMLPNKLDHIIKEELRIKGYGRYMDDGYLIHEDIHYLEYCLERIKEVCAELGITLNLRKTKIRPITRGIVFLKTKFILTETGRVLRKMSRASMRAMKRKLFKFRKWYEAGEFSLEDIRTAYDSFKGHMRRGDSFKAVARIDLFFKHLFGFHPNDKTKWRATNVPNRKRWDYSGADRATKLCRAA